MRHFLVPFCVYHAGQYPTKLHLEGRWSTWRPRLMAIKEYTAKCINIQQKVDLSWFSKQGISQLYATCVQLWSYNTVQTGKFEVTLGNTTASTAMFFPPKFEGWALNCTTEREDLSMIPPNFRKMLLSWQVKLSYQTFSNEGRRWHQI